jgi:hypothetical protein
MAKCCPNSDSAVHAMVSVQYATNSTAINGTVHLD